MINTHKIRRPVDYGEEFLKSGMTLITDHRSDYYLKKNESSKLATQFGQTPEEKSETTGTS